MIKNFIFQGGGVKGIAYAGALQVAENRGILKNVVRTAGTSAGAITALLVALNLTAAQINNILSITNFSNFEDSKNVLRLAENYGLYKGDFFLQWITEIISKLTNGKPLTFKDLKTYGFKDLSVVTTELNTGKIKICSTATTPDILVAEAVRASMSIPGVFSVFRFTQGANPNFSYVDGGTLWNLPIEIYDTPGVLNNETLGFGLIDFEDQETSVPLGEWEPITWGKLCFEAILSDQTDRLLIGDVNHFRVVAIDDFNISATDFSLDESTKQKLFQSGIAATMNYLDGVDTFKTVLKSMIFNKKKKLTLNQS